MQLTSNCIKKYYGRVSVNVFFRKGTIMLKRFWNDEQGVAAIEYAIIAAVIAVGLIAVMLAIGGKVNNKMSSVNTNLTGAGY